MTIRTRNFAIPLALVLAWAPPTQANPPGSVQFFAAGKIRQGIALADFAHEMIVMGRDGWIHSIDPRDPKSKVNPLTERYEPATVVELRNDLQREFGRAFEVVATKNFLVVQPRGRGDRWPRLFESSHRSFTDFMKKLGVTVREGRFPMVAVVFPDQAAMYREFQRHGIEVTRVAGLYSGESNRVMTHDGGHSAQIAATVRHEAAHQSGFNTGVHSRLNETPRWITEGIGQMFEPEAMVNSRSASVRERLNAESMAYLARHFDDRHDTRLSEAVMELVSDDKMFESERQIEGAYHVAWAMMFYLAERKPQAFARLLNHTSARPPFQPYPRAERIKDFERIVGVDTFEFSKRMAWYLQEL